MQDPEDPQAESVPPAKSVPLANSDMSFEHALEKLEQLVNAMESGNLNLEESLAAFENGIQLTRNCQKALQTAEQRVQILIENSGSAILQDLDPASTT